MFCPECKTIDICVNCFANGKETEQHRNYHDYHIINKLDFPLFYDDWKAEEELLLIEGIEKFGFGNW